MSEYLQNICKAHYEYDAWGNVLSITDQNGNAITSATHVGNLNPFRYRGYYYDSETGFYYLMSRYYDPVTHRFINADGYFQSGGGILDTNMSAYCRNNPIKFVDSYGTTVYTVGITLFGSFGIAVPISLYYACDDKGNGGIFASACDYNESGGLGIVNISGSITSSVIWDADTIDDLDKNFSNWGFSVGEGFTIGLDLICLEDYEMPSGISISAGLGAGIDWAHAYTTTTKQITSMNNDFNTKNTSISTPKTTTGKSNTSTTKIQTQCRACGRPIGNQYAWQCSSPSYY